MWECDVCLLREFRILSNSLVSGRRDAHHRACIEDPVVIKVILAHLAGKARPVHAPRLPPGRAPPAQG